MIAIDRPMPSSCEECPCCDDYYRCGASSKKFDEDFEIWERRLPDCPLMDLSKYEGDCK